jgi:hypothetical protein
MTGANQTVGGSSNQLMAKKAAIPVRLPQMSVV